MNVSFDLCNIDIIKQNCDSPATTSAVFGNMTFSFTAIATSFFSASIECLRSIIICLSVLTLFLAWCSFLDQSVPTIYSTLNKIQAVKYDSENQSKSRYDSALKYLLTDVEGSSTHILSLKRFHSIFGIFIVLVIHESIGPLEDKQSKKVSEAEEARHAGESIRDDSDS